MENDKEKEGVVIEPTVEVDLVAEKDAEIAKLTEDRDNYKAVALKRLGKLPGDADFMGDGELSVAEQIKLALLDKEIEAANRVKEELYKKTLRENSELKLALKNRPNQSIGGDSGATVEVKDNILTEPQLIALRERAAKLGADPEKFIENFKKTLTKNK